MPEWPNARGKRGKRKDDPDPIKQTTMTARAVEAGKFWDCKDRIETYDTRTDNIRTFAQPDYSHSERYLYHLKGKRRLLNRGNPFAMPEDVKRMTARSKRVKLDPDSPAYERTPKGNTRPAAPIRWFSDAEIQAENARRES